MKLKTWNPRIGDVVTVNRHTLALSAEWRHIPYERQYMVIGQAKGVAEYWLQDLETGELPTTRRNSRTAGFTPRELIPA